MITRHATFFLLALMAGVAGAQLARADSTYKLLKKVAYANVDGAQLMLEVIVPTGNPNGLGMIYVASGAGYADRGKTDDRSPEEARVAETFCGRGYLLFVVRPGPAFKYNVIDMADHLQRAILFVKQNSDQYQIDASRLGLLSTSAGVHLVSLVAVTATDQSAVKAAGVYFPPRDLKNKESQNIYIQANEKAWDQVTKQAFPGGIAPAPANSTAADADGGALDIRVKLPQVSRKAPRFLIVHGDADPLAMKGTSNLYFTAMRDAGVATDMVVKRPGGDPGPTIRAEIETLANWFDKQFARE